MVKVTFGTQILTHTAFTPSEVTGLILSFVLLWELSRGQVREPLWSDLEGKSQLLLHVWFVVLNKRLFQEF